MNSASTFERRQATRVRVVIPIEVRESRGFSLHSSSDLSIGGVYFDRAIPHSIGARVELSFNLPGDYRTLICAGEVVNVPDTRGYGMGVRFLDLSPTNEAILDDFIEGHRAKPKDLRDASRDDLRSRSSREQRLRQCLSTDHLR